MSKKNINNKQKKQNKKNAQDEEDNRMLDECIKNNNLMLTKNNLTELEETEVEKYYNEIDNELQQKHSVYMKINPLDENDTEGYFTEEQQLELFARNINFWNMEYEKLDTSPDIKSLTRNLMVSHSREKSHELIKEKFSEDIQQKIWAKVVLLSQEENNQ
jgi:hypothetical protein